MDIDKLKSEAKIGKISNEYVNYLKSLYISKVLEGKTPKTVNVLVAYANFLNKSGINPDNYPLYLKILESNNKYAIDALLEGYELEKYLDCVAPNHFIIKSIFKIFSIYRRNEIYEKTLRVLFGFLIKVYNSPEEGYRIYPPSIADVNNLGKLLNEIEDQDDKLNRDILDILMYISDLDTPYETDNDKKDIARQSGRLRSDYFDNRRKLSQSLTEVMLEEAEKPSLGIPPDYTYTND